MSQHLLVLPDSSVIGSSVPTPDRVAAKVLVADSALLASGN
jgi:hypothetical protein